MPPTEPQTALCPECKIRVPLKKDKCTICGTALFQDTQENGSSQKDESNLQTDQNDTASSDTKPSSGFSGIFNMAEEIKNQEKRLDDEGAQPKSSTQHSGFSGVFQMAEEAVSDSKPSPESVPKSNGHANRKPQESKPASSGFSGVFRLAEDLNEGTQDSFSEPPATTPPSNQPPRNQQAAKPTSPTPLPPDQLPNAPSSGFSGVFHVADDVRSGSPREDFGNTLTPEQTRTRPSEPQPKQPLTPGANGKASPGMASVEFDSETPLPPNRTADTPAQSDVIRLACKACGRKLRVKKNRAGQKIKCPKCESVVAVPALRDASGESQTSGKRRLGNTSIEFTFADLAKQLDASDSDETAGHGTEAGREKAKAEKSKKSLSSRKYRQLTKLLEQNGPLNAQQIRERADALRELGQSGDSRAYEFLAKDVNHPELQIRQAAAVGLGDLCDSQAVPLLVGLLDDPSKVLRKAAILGLGKIKDPRSIRPLLLFGLDDPQMKFLASEAVANMGEHAVHPLIEVLDDSERGLVLEAIVLLGRLKNPKARRALIGVIDARQPLLQCHAIEALGQIADPKSIGPLSRLLEDADCNVRMTAAAALSKMPSDKNIVPPLLNALGDSDEEVVVRAAFGLGESGDKRAAEPLARLLRSPAEKIRIASAQALGALGDQRAVPHLLELLEEDSDETKLKVLGTLRAMKPPHTSGSLLKHLDNSNPAVRRRVVDVLGPIGDAEVAERLEHVLRMDPADEVRMAAARSLGEIADPASVDCLKDAIHNDEFNVRCQAIGALGQIGDEECYNTLFLLLDDQVAEVRFHAATALGEIGNDKAVPKLKDLLKDKNPMVVRGASKALEKLGVENVENQVKIAQRSRKMEAIQGIFETVKSWFPDSVHGQKIILGGSLAVVLLVLGLGWLGFKLMQGPPAQVIPLGNVETITFSPDGSQIVVGRTLGLVQVWSASSGNLDHKLTPPDGKRAIATPDPKILALITGTAVQLWTIGGGEDQLAPKPGHAKGISQYRLTLDKTKVATLGADGVAIVWDLKNGQPQGPAVQLGTTPPAGFSVSADVSRFAGGNSKGEVTVWDAATGQVVAQFTGTPPVMETCFSADGANLAVVFGKQLVVWDMNPRSKPIPVSDLAGLAQIQFDPSGKKLLATRGGEVLLWDVTTMGNPDAKPKSIATPSSQIDTLSITLDGSQFALGGKEQPSVWVYDINSGEMLKQLNPQ